MNRTFSFTLLEGQEVPVWFPQGASYPYVVVSLNEYLRLKARAGELERHPEEAYELPVDVDEIFEQMRQSTSQED